MDLGRAARCERPSEPELVRGAGRATQPRTARPGRLPVGNVPARSHSSSESSRTCGRATRPRCGATRGPTLDWVCARLPTRRGGGRPAAHAERRAGSAAALPVWPCLPTVRTRGCRGSGSDGAHAGRLPIRAGSWSRPSSSTPPGEAWPAAGGQGPARSHSSSESDRPRRDVARLGCDLARECLRVRPRAYERLDGLVARQPPRARVRMGAEAEVEARGGVGSRRGERGIWWAGGRGGERSVRPLPGPRGRRRRGAGAREAVGR